MNLSYKGKGQRKICNKKKKINYFVRGRRENKFSTSS